MQSIDQTISVTLVEDMESPQPKLGLKSRSNRSNSRHSWVHGSPRSCTSGQSANHGTAASQFLTLPQQPAQDPYSTPKYKDSYMNDQSPEANQYRLQKQLQAPKKRDEMFGECSARKQRAYDPQNLSIRAFKLDGYSPSSGSEGEQSTENSSRRSEENNDRQQAMDEVRGEWNAFSKRIMDVQIVRM